MSVPDGRTESNGGDKWSLYHALRQTPPDDSQVPAEPQEILPAWEPTAVTWPTVPWDGAQKAVTELYSLNGDQFAAVLREWQRGDPDFLEHLSDRALVALRMAAEAECYFRFAVRRSQSD